MNAIKRKIWEKKSKVALIEGIPEEEDWENKVSDIGAQDRLSVSEEAISKNDTINDQRKQARVEQIRALVAPVFGVSAIQLFPLMASFIVICHFNWMPWGLSELWLLLPLGIVLKYFANRKEKIDKAAVLGMVVDPQLLSMVAQEMPLWYSFKDVETAAWINSTLQQLWPFIDEGVCSNLRENVVPPLIENLVPGLRLKLTKLTLGCVAPKITSIRASHASKSEVHLDMEVSQSTFSFELNCMIEPLRFSPFVLSYLRIVLKCRSSGAQICLLSWK